MCSTFPGWGLVGLTCLVLCYIGATKDSRMESKTTEARNNWTMEKSEKCSELDTLM